MKIEAIKAEFHELINHVDDPELLLQFYDAINRSVQPGSLWQSLSKEQQQGVLDAYDESEEESNLIPYATLQAKYKEWPSK